MKTTTETAPRIYIACLSAYNAGFLNGRWIDAQSDENDMLKEIEEILEESQKILLDNKAIFEHDVCEEWAIHDYEGFNIKIEEYTDLATIAEYMEVLESCSDDQEFEIICKYGDYIGSSDLDSAKSDYEDHFAGVWNSFQEYSDNFVDDCILIDNNNETLARYFDYESFARDLDYDMLTIELDSGEVAVFHNQ